MAVLVTGGAGYIGSHTVVALHSAGREVVILDDFSRASRRAIDAVRGLTDAALPVVEGDAADRALLRRAFARHSIDAVIHFAAFKSVPESASVPLAYYRNNLASAISAAEAAAEHGASRFVFSSSAAVYGMPKSAPVTEASALEPVSPYGRTKLMGEQILADAAAATGLEVVLLRYFNPVGAHPSGRIGEDPKGLPGNLVPRVMQAAAGRLGPVPVFGGDYRTRDGTAVRDYVHVEDVAEGHVAALAADCAERAPAYNLGTGTGSSVLEVLAAAAAEVGRPIPFRMAERRPGDPARVWADCGRARRELGWAARRDLTAMLRDHWNWQRRNPDGYGG